jgi:hypothetical protein
MLRHDKLKAMPTSEHRILHKHTPTNNNQLIPFSKRIFAYSRGPFNKFTCPLDNHLTPTTIVRNVNYYEDLGDSIFISNLFILGVNQIFGTRLDAPNQDFILFYQKKKRGHKHIP